MGVELAGQRDRIANIGGWNVMFETPFTSPARATASIVMSMSVSVCVSVCLSVCPWSYLRNHTRDLYQIFVHVASGRVARSSSGVVAICYVLPVLWMTSCFFNNGPYSSMTDFAKIYLFTIRADRIQVPIIKRHNFWLTISKLLTNWIKRGTEKLDD